MISIIKPDAPEILRTKGVEQTKKDCEMYDSCADDYRSGKAKFDHDNGIYNAEEVKQCLLAAQHNKCCYCESKFRSTSYGDIEHYRPKGAVKREPGAKKEYPGYHWLANEWENLLVSCQICNQQHKGMLFPLRNPEARARSYYEDVSAEEPLLINPGTQDPRKHIGFSNEEPVAYDDIGQTTIEVLGLRRTDLQEERLEKYKKLKEELTMVVAASLSELNKEGGSSEHPPLSNVGKFIEAATRPDNEFCSMSQDFILEWLAKAKQHMEGLGAFINMLQVKSD